MHDIWHFCISIMLLNSLNGSSNFLNGALTINFIANEQFIYDHEVKYTYGNLITGYIECPVASLCILQMRWD